MIDLKPNDGAQAIGTKTRVNKVVINKTFLNEKPVNDFIERMRARGFNVETDGINAIITGDDLGAYFDEIRQLAIDTTPLYEKYFG